MPIIISTTPFEGERTDRLIEDNVKLTVTPPLKDREFGRGQLIISEQNLYWTDSQVYVCINYTSIALHATMKDVTEPCVFCQLTSTVYVDEAGIPLQESEINQSSEEVSIELRFIPEDGSKIDQLFQIMSECSHLHVDEPNPDLDTDGWITSENVDKFMPALEQVEALERLDSVLNENGKRTGQFDDANEVLR